MIVDDFTADRENLKDILNSISDADICIVSECENGLQALESIQNCQPDIIISDIEMPFLDGIGLARAVKRDYPNIKIIFCTLYDEFEYAREALYLDSYGYVLKPINPEELRECIVKVSESIYSEFQNARAHEELKKLLYESIPVLAEDFVRSLVYGLIKDEKQIWEKAEFLRLDIMNKAYVLALIEIDDYDEIAVGLTLEEKQILTLKVYEKIKKEIGSDTGVLTAKLDESHFVILFSCLRGSNDEEYTKKASDTCNNVLMRFNRSDVTITIAISGHSYNIQDIKNLFEQCSYAIRHKYFLGKGKIIFDRDVPSATKVPDIDINQMQKEIRFLLNAGRKEEISRYVNKLFDQVPHGVAQSYYKNLCFSIVICMQVVLNENNCGF